MSEKEDAQGSEDDHAGVRFPPPFIILSFLVAGIMADSPWVTGSLATLPAMVMGGLVFALGAVLAKSSVPRHRKAGSNVEPWKPTTKIISDGVYGRSRNHIYLALVLGYIGVAIAAGSIAAFVSLIPCLLVMRYYVIGREERYLEVKFGADYTDYKSRVRRWI